MDKPTCQMCGAFLKAEAKFCSTCGAKTSPAALPVPTQAAPLVDSANHSYDGIGKASAEVSVPVSVPVSIPKRSINRIPLENPIESDIEIAAESAKPAKPPNPAKTAKKAAVKPLAEKQNTLNSLKKRDNGFSNKFAAIAGTTIKTILCVFFVGMLAACLFVMFKKGMIKLPFAVGGVAQQQETLPSLTGDWMIRCNEENSDKIEKYAVMAVQHGPSIIGKGSDERGDYYISGRITPPATIELSKVRFAQDKPQQPFFFSGTFKLDSQPLSAAGEWNGQQHFDVGKNSKSKVKAKYLSGSWSGNFFPNPDYNSEKIQPPGPLPPPAPPKHPIATLASSKPAPSKQTHSAHPTHPPKPAHPHVEN